MLTGHFRHRISEFRQLIAFDAGQPAISWDRRVEQGPVAFVPPSRNHQKEKTISPNVRFVTIDEDCWSRR